MLVFQTNTVQKRPEEQVQASQIMKVPFPAKNETGQKAISLVEKMLTGIYNNPVV